LQKASRKPCAVYVTSPDYLGRIADIRSLAEVCREFSVPLLVDNAHGAYLNFLSPSLHPIALGAWACCDSAHKTLPVLTGGAYLHISKCAPASFTEGARNALSLFASTSPSYLILQSLDLCNRYLSEDFSKKLQIFIKKIEKIKSKMSQKGFSPEESEPLKIVLHTAKYGYTGEEFCEHLKRFHIVPEFYDNEYLVLMITPENTDLDFERLELAFSSVVPKPSLPTIAYLPQKAITRLSAKKALLSPQETVSTEKALGRICAAPSVSCPPAVPIVISGEIIKKEAVNALRYYGNETVCVVAKDSQ
jgi:arginine/lysine/ornithine decarboxylase